MDMDSLVKVMNPLLFLLATADSVRALIVSHREYMIYRLFYADCVGC
jgi:hypothetical protein